MLLEQRLNLLVQLGEYMLSDEPAWLDAKEKAFRSNSWFIPAFIDHSAENIARSYLKKEVLQNVAMTYQIPHTNPTPKTIGIVMAGNVPMVGFHDLLCCFLTGHRLFIKSSSKDDVLIPHLVGWMIKQAPELGEVFVFSEIIKGADVYIATGSNNSSRYFEYYFAKYPHLIRKNRTGLAFLTGDETVSELEALADDVYLYFGLGCRNVTKLYVPEGYDFVPLLEAFKKYNVLFDHNKYKNNYDYQLAMLMINSRYYMTNGSIILHEDKSLFSPISVLHYEFVQDPLGEAQTFNNEERVQCLVGRGLIPFGSAQHPGLTDFADGADTLKFLLQA